MGSDITGNKRGVPTSPGSDVGLSVSMRVILAFLSFFPSKTMVKSASNHRILHNN